VSRLISPVDNYDLAFGTDVAAGYDWSGFFAPVGSPPAVNHAKAGGAAPERVGAGGSGHRLWMATRRGSPLLIRFPCLWAWSSISVAPE
jgi:hypothetical protein